VADTKATLVLSGTGDVIEPDDGIVAIGSGGSFACGGAGDAEALEAERERLGDGGDAYRQRDLHLHER